MAVVPAGSRARRRAGALLLAAPLLLGAEAPSPPGEAASARQAEKRPPLALRLVQKGERSGAPIQVEMEIEWAGPGVLDGRVEISFRRHRLDLGSLLTPPVALAPGLQRFPLTFPAHAVREQGEYLTASPRFLGGGGVIDLDPQLLSVPSEEERAFLVCAPDPGLGPLAEEAIGLAGAIRFEQWNPVSSDRSVFSRFVRPPPADLPDSPLGYLRFDLVLLTGQDFQALERRQLEALAAWVEGGGALLVAPRGTYQERHARFLDRLARSAGAGDGFPLEPSGWFRPAPEEHPLGLVRLRAGLGRAVVLLPREGVKQDLAGPAWREAALFLWRVRQDAARSIREGGAWKLPDRRPGRNRVWRQGRSEPEPLEEEVEPLPLGIDRLPLEEWLVPRLLPRTVRLIPFGSIVAVLAMFVLAVGPLDYFLLGLLRKRKLTWIIFPVLSAAFTFLVVLLARRHLGTAGHRGELVLLDAGPDGVPRRENRFELVFAARPERIAHQVEEGLLQPLASARREVPPGGPGWSGEISPASREPVVIEGRFPSSYTLRQQVGQWKPQVNRRLSFEPLSREPLSDEPTERGPSPRWEAMDGLLPLLRENRPPGVEAAEGLLSGERAPCRVTVLHGISVFSWTSGAKEFEVSKVPADPSFFPWRDGRPLPVSLSTRLGPGIFALAAAVSPSGGGDGEDLALLDPTDPREYLVVVERETARGLLVHRKLYREEE